MKIRYVLALSLMALGSGMLSAQTTTIENRCGVGLEEGALIKERMLENRRTIPAEDVERFMNSRATKYIPVKVHIIGDANGNAYANIDNVFAMLCDMNNDYATQDVKFYLRDVTNSFRYANNQSVYENGSGFSASSYMVSNKSSNCVNIYLSASVNNQVASYYSSFGDYIFVLNQMANGSSSTGSHEVGHFFTLPHTFYGWENTDVTPYGTGNVPTSVSGASTERADRSGTCSNCATAADGFCDTPADYMSDRANCPFSQGVHDFCGNLIDPEESLIMSYYADACVDSFTPEQKGAMAADMISRGWNTLSAPSPNNTVTGTGMTATNPANNAMVPLADVTLTWGAVTGATGYVLNVQRSFAGQPIGEVVSTIVYGTNSYTIPVSKLDQPRQYIWKVKPFNQLSYCGGYSSTFGFSTTLPSGIDVNFNESAELRILSNPVNTNQAQILVNVPQNLQAGIKIYGMDGRQVANIENLSLYTGDNFQMLDVSSLNTGVYMVVVSTEMGSLQQKMVITR